MSRLIVKNLPPYVTPARLREHFEQKGGPGGTLTDFKVARKPDGTSRRFGFLGYKTEGEAVTAKEWFDRTFIGSARISVEVVEGTRDAPIPRPNKRPRLGPSPSERPTTEKPTAEITNVEKSTTSNAYPHLDEYMETMKPRTKKVPVWDNEGERQQAAPPIPELEAIHDVPINRDETNDAISDLEWIKQHTKEDVNIQEKVFEQSDDEGVVDETPKTTPKPQPEGQKDPTKETILQTSRLFVRNLTFLCTDADLLKFFSPFGEVLQVHIPLDAQKQSKGIAYVTFRKSSDALAAYEALDRKSFQGRLIHILGAVDKDGNADVKEGTGQKRTVKGDKLAKKKASAGRDFNWSMLYMNSDAVASSVADRLNIDKSSILNPESGENAAVKLALAETHVIQETKAYLESQGVFLSSFSSTSRARSETTILVKNIPYGTSVDQVREIFEPHGELWRVLVPPAGTIAVVEFKRPDEAAKAFRAVAYHRLGNSVVYLEKGPLGMFTEGSLTDPISSSLSHTPSSSSAAQVHGVQIVEQEMGIGAGEEEEPSIAGGTTLYVKNLSFSTTQERLVKMFGHLPSFAFARVQTKPDPNRPEGPRLSMGYGFVGFRDVEGAKKALGSMQGFVLDGHALHVKFAGRGQEEPERKGGEAKVMAGARTTKMIVKNVPFEATKKDVRALFGAYGHLKSVRLPKKFDSRTRGFAFLDFVSRSEAENAYAALRHTHLLGRHLVLEWAEEAEQDLDALRKKAGVGYGDGKGMPGMKRKLNLRKTAEEDPEGMEG